MDVTSREESYLQDGLYQAMEEIRHPSLRITRQACLGRAVVQAELDELRKKVMDAFWDTVDGPIRVEPKGRTIRQLAGIVHIPEEAVEHIILRLYPESVIREQETPTEIYALAPSLYSAQKEVPIQHTSPASTCSDLCRSLLELMLRPGAVASAGYTVGGLYCELSRTKKGEHPETLIRAALKFHEEFDGSVWCSKDDDELAVVLWNLRRDG